MSARIIWIWLQVIVAFGALSSAQAHPLNLGYMQITKVESQLHVSLQMNIQAAQDFANGNQTLFAATLGQSEWSSSAHRCDWRDFKSVEGHGDQGLQVDVQATLVCERLGSQLNGTLSFLAKAPTTYRVLGRVDDGHQQSTFIADAQNRNVKLNLDIESGFLQIVRMGAAHIGALPSEWHGPESFHWPDGIDHILFVLALILGGGSIKSLIRTISGFTLGHSVTLAISALHLVHFPARIVESMIALSIVYVAMEAFLLKNSEHRWRVAAVFGLFHGLGFAAALRELDFSSTGIIKTIIGFNLGVELGQVMIILFVAPIVYLAKCRPAFETNLFIRTSSLLIAGMGTYWFIERLFW